MRLSDFDYNLPQDSIAQFPAKERADSRLLLLGRSNAEISHHKFSQLCTFLNKGDLLVLNDTKVSKARLVGSRVGFQGKIEILLIDRLQDNIYACLAKPARRFKSGTRLVFGDGRLEAEVLSSEGDFKHIRFNTDGDLSIILDRIGQVPLPPYIKRAPEEQDKHRYQTVYANNIGAVAAPTAGLHFTKELLSEIKGRGVEIAYITLHVGYATFKPVTEDEISMHKMHKEYFEISKPVAEKINRAKDIGRRVIVVGTTTCRALESAAIKRKTSLDFARDRQVLRSKQVSAIRDTKEWTDLFIYPGYDFKVIDGLLTNFHFPRTTLLMLVSAFYGKDNLMKAYNEAIKERYRFYSYGDAMLIL